MPTVTYQVSTSAGDAREDSTGMVGVIFYDLLFGNNGGLNKRWQFMRFINVDVPQGAIIDSAYLKLTSYTPAGAGTRPEPIIYAEKQPNPATITSSHLTVTSEISTRSRTSSSVQWTTPGFTTADTEYTSPSIASVIQEIVNQSGWVNGNAINIITDCGVVAGTNYFDTYAYDGNPSRAAVLEISYSLPTAETVNAGKPKTKTFFHKVYDNAGNYLTTWAKDVINKPEFNWKMNGGMGEMVIKLKRELKDYEEGTNIAVGNIVKTYVQDGDREIGTKIWEGILNRYEPTVLSDGSQGVLIRCVSHTITQQYRIVRDSQNNTTAAYASTDPTNIFKSLINSKWNNGTLKVGTMNLTGTTVSYTFRGDTFMNAYDIIVKLSPQYWYWYLDAENFIHFKEADFNEVNHKLVLGKHIIRMNVTKSIENMVNRVLFMGGGSPPLYRKYERTGSQTEWGLRELFIKDERVTVAATAQLIAESHMDIYDHPISIIEIEVLDNNIDPINGYDLERLKPGDIVQILDPMQENFATLWDIFDWDINYWDFDVTKSIGQPQQIKEIRYGFNTATLFLSEKAISLEKRMEDINRNLETTAKLNLPSQPS